MELFSEIYNCYYQVVARMMEECQTHPLTRQELTQIADTYGYEESALAILPNLMDGSWKLLADAESSRKNGRDDRECSHSYRTVLTHTPAMPLTSLQKSWLKSLLEDARISLFFTDEQLSALQEYLADVTPLYHPSDFCYFDQYADRDQFGLTSYRNHFQLILKGIRSRQALRISYYSGKNRTMEHTYLPARLEYSPKDGKFRLYALYRKKNGRYRIDQLNIGRIMRIVETGFYSREAIDIDQYMDSCLCRQPVVLEISSERNALERTMLHFSCYQKKVEKLEEDGRYRCSIYYDKTRETELLIQVLSFGPVVKVVGPEPFLRQVKERVRKQAALDSQ